MENATQLRYVFGEIDERLGERNVIPLFSVSQTRGVIPRSEVSDNGGRADSVSKYKVVRKNDLVLNRFNAYRGSLGIAPGYGLVSPDYAVLRPREADPRYFDYWFRSDEISNFMKSTMGGLGAQDPDTSGFSRINLPEVMRLPIRITDEIERAKIADFLDRETAKIDVLIAKQEQLITTLDERRQAVISRAVTRGIIEGRPLHYSGVEWLGEIPTAWECKPVRSLMRFNSEKNTGYKSNNYLSLMANVGVILYEDKGAVGNKSPEDLEKCKIVRTGDFVLNSMNFGIGSFGVSPYDGVCSTVYVVMTPASKACSPSFLKHIFSMKPFQKHAQSLGDGILEHRAAIGWHDLKNLGFPVPPLEEQQAIADFLDRETAQIDELNAQAKRMTELFKERRQALISAAVTGKLEVSV